MPGRAALSEYITFYSQHHEYYTETSPTYAHVRPIPEVSHLLKLTLETARVVLLEQSRAVGVWIHGDTVERVELRSTVKHILIDLAVVATEGAVELPVREVP